MYRHFHILLVAIFLLPFYFFFLFYKIGIDSSLLECFNSISSSDDNINPMNYIDSLTSNQFYRAKKIVYKYNK